MRPDGGFLNVDLEVGARSRAQLAPLIDALDAELVELFSGRIRGLYRAHYEAQGCSATASGTIRDLVAVIRRLPSAARKAWATAAMRDFNVGVEIPSHTRSVELAIDPDAVAEVAALGGRIAITAYGALRPARRRASR